MPISSFVVQLPLTKYSTNPYHEALLTNSNFLYNEYSQNYSVQALFGLHQLINSHFCNQLTNCTNHYSAIIHWFSSYIFFHKTSRNLAEVITDIYSVHPLPQIAYVHQRFQPVDHQCVMQKLTEDFVFSSLITERIPSFQHAIQFTNPKKNLLFHTGISCKTGTAKSGPLIKHHMWSKARKYKWSIFTLLNEQQVLHSYCTSAENGLFHRDEFCRLYLGRKPIMVSLRALFMAENHDNILCTNCSLVVTSNLKFGVINSWS